MPDGSALFDKGLPIRRAVLGDEHVDRSLVGADGFTMAVQRVVTAWGSGWAWGDPALDRRARSLVNFAMLTALGRPHELKLHVEGALNNGVTVEEIRAALLHATAYCGIPARARRVQGGARGAHGGGRAARRREARRASDRLRGARRRPPPGPSERVRRPVPAARQEEPDAAAGPARTRPHQPTLPCDTPAGAAVRPPSATYCAPVTLPARSEHRNRTRFATSSAVP